MSFQIREYSKDDFNSVIELMITLQDYFFEIDSSNHMRKFASVEEAKTYIKQGLKDVEEMDGVSFVAEVDGQVVGFVQGVITTYKDEVMHTLGHQKTKDGWIGLLFTRSEFRGKGIGKGLINEMKQYFLKKECHSVKLLVTNDNALAIDVYKKYGFKTTNLEMTLDLRNAPIS